MRWLQLTSGGTAILAGATLYLTTRLPVMLPMGLIVLGVWLIFSRRISASGKHIDVEISRQPQLAALRQKGRRAALIGYAIAGTGLLAGYLEYSVLQARHGLVGLGIAVGLAAAGLAVITYGNFVVFDAERKAQPDR